jgi:hypothetical protein
VSAAQPAAGVPRLCIFARAPIPGRVKSRLALEIGAAAALEAHVQLVEDTLQRLARVDGVVNELWLDDTDDVGGRGWAERWGLPLQRQTGDDLGERMHRALLSCLDAGCPGIVVGTDCPAIDAAYVQHAVVGLGRNDLVLGPAADGGYGLVALRRPLPEIFRGIDWGTSRVLAATLDAATAAGVVPLLLPEIWDVDTAGDWRRYLAWRARG